MDFESKIKDALYKRLLAKIKQLTISLWFFIFVKFFLQHALVLLNKFLFINVVW